MKIFRHIFVVLLLLFISTTATAQSQSDNTQTKAVSATKADVNGDGVVNEADIEEILAIMQQENGTKYYWYINNDPEILFGDPVGEVVDYSKARQVSSFDELQYASDGTQITMKNTGRNSVFILCPAEWVNNWSIYNQANNVDLTTGFTDISEFITNLNNNGVEYKFFEASGVAGNTLFIRRNK